MDAEHDEAANAESRAANGLRRLMLRLPSSRLQLLMLYRQQPAAIAGLCAAYEDASLMYFSLLRHDDPSQLNIIEEYRQICAEIEDEVLRYCTNPRSNVPK